MFAHAYRSIELRHRRAQFGFPGPHSGHGMPRATDSFRLWKPQGLWLWEPPGSGWGRVALQRSHRSGPRIAFPLMCRGWLSRLVRGSRRMLTTSNLTDRNTGRSEARRVPHTHYRLCLLPRRRPQLEWRGFPKLSSGIAESSGTNYLLAQVALMADGTRRILGGRLPCS